MQTGHFFATSHGKSPCDGIGSTVKRLVAWASLQATTEGHILTPQELYAWASKNIIGISFFFVSANDVKENEISFALEDRYSTIKKIPGTRSHHAFMVTADGNLQMKRISVDTTNSITNLNIDIVEDKEPVNNTDSYQPGQYVACLYDKNWHLGNIVDRSDSNQDELIHFMQRNANKRLTWPHREDKCWVPFVHVLCTVAAPEIECASGRQYKISDTELDRILHSFNHRKQ